TYYESLLYLKDKGWVNGYKNGSFLPYHTINRAEFVKIVVEMIGYGSADGQQLKFKDVDVSAWYAGYLKKAIANGLVKGYPDGTFRPGDEISFVEASKILATAKKLTVKNEIGEWYVPYVKAMENAKAIPVSVNGFSKKISRGEMAEMIWQLSTKKSESTQTYAGLVNLSAQSKEQVTFDACGKIINYKDSNWFDNFDADLDKIGFSVEGQNGSEEWITYDLDSYSVSDYSELCYSENGQIVVVAFDAEHIFKYDLKTRMFYPARMLNGRALSEFVTFGKRVGNTIPFKSKYGDAGCMFEHDGVYDFEANTTLLTSDNSYCVEN
ncbi:S-layer homology domain-containing protein, partial [Candidatus Peregrinibacteria bacterium]|nr:S-layer homology domain-containing protein [Candidatus Peregrinibacteria bacterium]